jgi:hypothetical protein
VKAPSASFSAMRSKVVLPLVSVSRAARSAAPLTPDAVNVASSSVLSRDQPPPVAPANVVASMNGRVDFV